MEYTCGYSSPIGEMTMASDGRQLTGLWFNGQKYFGSTLEREYRALPGDGGESELPVFARTKKWLDVYFAGERPASRPPLAPKGSAFRQKVWKILMEIPYGETITYKEIAGRLFEERAEEKGVEKRGEKRRRGMSAQAVGGAVGHNPISIIIPCHRVLGCGGQLTGYAGGLDKKEYLLKLEEKERR